jgi:hypothetical protein
VTGTVPCESTIRRVLQAWTLMPLMTWPVPGRPAHRAGAGGAAGHCGGRQDLTRLRRGGEGSHHLLAAFDHGHGVVMGQAEVGAKTSEIPMFTRLLDRIAIAGAGITADAMHAQRAHAGCLAGCGAHYLLTVRLCRSPDSKPGSITAGDDIEPTR